MKEVSTAIEASSLGVSEAGLNQANLSIGNEKTTWLGKLNERVSEWCSSILVKETRQSLKSRHFIWTYLALIVCVGFWTLIGLTNSYYDLYRAGRTLLTGFWVILGFPLALIIPFSAYRSLAREFEDGTISLISITTMKPYQIVIGKFGSAVLQMVIYLSVLAPCICFTYILRGISLNQIILGLSICVGGSLFLTVLGLFLAGVFRSRALSVGVSVLFVLMLGWLYFGWCAISYEITNFGDSMNEMGDEFSIGVYSFSAFFGSTAALLLVTAAAQISFPADNRSTLIRVAMFVQQVLFCGFAILIMPFGESEFATAILMISGHYWLIMGFLMIGESVFISRRVQRTLPRTYFSRSFFSLFMPGAGRGFLFAIANVWFCGIFLLLIIHFHELLLDEEMQTPNGWGFVANWSVTRDLIFQVLSSSLFVSWFLAIIYLLMRCFDQAKTRWSTGVGPIVSLILGGLFVAGLSIGTMIAHQVFVSGRYNATPTAPLASNWYYVTITMGERGSSGSYSSIASWHILFALQQVVVLCIALGVASRELLLKPIAVPERVQIETTKTKRTHVEAGESIDEIFGELKPKESSNAPDSSSEK